MIQAGLLTPLTFARYRLSPLAAFTSMRAFFTMEGGDSEFASFTLPTLKAFLEACSHNGGGANNNSTGKSLGRRRILTLKPPITRHVETQLRHPSARAAHVFPQPGEKNLNGGCAIYAIAFLSARYSPC